MPDPLSVVEHLTIPGFIRRCPHRFHMQEILRYGDQVGKIAESLQVSYLTTIDRQLGQIRLFPVPLLTRVYEVMAAQFGWEPIIDAAPALEDPRKTGADLLRSHERVDRHLRAVLEAAENRDVQDSIAVVLGWMGKEMQRLRAECAVSDPADA